MNNFLVIVFVFTGYCAVVLGHHHHHHYGGEAPEAAENEVLGEFAEKLSKFSLNVFKNTLKSPFLTPTSYEAAAAAAAGGNAPNPAPRASANLFMAPLTAVSPLVMRSLAFENMFESVEEVMELMHLNRAFNNRFGGGHGPAGAAARNPMQLANVFHQILGLFNPMQWNQARNFYPPPQPRPVLPPVYTPPFPEIPPPHPMLPHETPGFRHNIYRGGRLSPLEQLPSSGTSAALMAAPSSLDMPTVSPFKHDPNDGLQVAYFSKFLVPNQLSVNQTFAQHLHSTFGAEVYQLDPHMSAPQVIDQLEQMLYVNHSAAPEFAATTVAPPSVDTNATSPKSEVTFLADQNVVQAVGKTFERLVQPSWFDSSPSAAHTVHVPSSTAIEPPSPPLPSASLIQPQVILAPEPPPQQQQNAMFVNGVDVNTQWEYVFDPRKTRREPFHANLYDAPEVDMMHQEGIFSVGQEDNILALKLPLRGNQHSMLIMMPKKPKHTAQANIKQILNELSWDTLRELRSEMRPRPVRLGLPRFRTTSAMNMMQPLRMAGLRKQPTLNDYAGAFVDPLADAGSTPSQILHFANIDINEAYDPRSSALTAGDSAQAARAAAFQAAAARQEHIMNFIADKPFVYIITHEPTGTVLFAGKVENPAISEPSFSAPPSVPAPPPPLPPMPATNQLLVSVSDTGASSQLSPAEVLISGVETLPPGSAAGTQTLVTAVNPPPFTDTAGATPEVVLTGLDAPLPAVSVSERQTLFDAPPSAGSSATGGGKLAPLTLSNDPAVTVVEMTRPNFELIGTPADAPVKKISGTKILTPLEVLK